MSTALCRCVTLVPFVLLINYFHFSCRLIAIPSRAASSASVRKDCGTKRSATNSSRVARARTGGCGHQLHSYHHQRTAAPMNREKAVAIQTEIPDLSILSSVPDRCRPATMMVTPYPLQWEKGTHPPRGKHRVLLQVNAVGGADTPGKI